jgi:hypothetical protein
MLFPREWRKDPFAKANSDLIRRSFTFATAPQSSICELAEKWIISHESVNKIGLKSDKLLVSPISAALQDLDAHGGCT